MLCAQSCCMHLANNWRADLLDLSPTLSRNIAQLLFNPEVEAPIAGPGGGGGGVGGLGGGVAGVSSGGGGAGPMSVELRVHVVPNANALPL
mmetsp:Transcript_15078/g.21979  ORF Transcript_15078/g.21979 Transcript_15078/m.21979 type:complete len:91 (-) Transcript_15078:61-333(-)